MEKNRNTEQVSGSGRITGESMDRREFFSRMAKAGLVAAGASALGFFTHDPKGPSASEPEPETVLLPTFAMEDKKPAMVIATGVVERKKALEEAVKALGGMESFIKKGDRVLLKVNAAFASPPSLCATTHPDLVAATTRLCLAAGAESVRVTDNPINDPATCFSLSGIESAAGKAGAKVILPRDHYFRSTTVNNGSLIKNWPLLHEPFSGVTKLIGLAPVKDHHRSGASMTIKNWYGLLGGARNIFHQDIHNIIKELAMMVTPTLVILDGTVSMMANGPTGGSLSDLKPTQTLIIGTDQVAVDSYGATLLGKSPERLPHLVKAREVGAGTVDYESLNPIRVNVS